MVKWTQIRELYPNQWVKLRILKSHEKEGYLYIDDISLDNFNFYIGSIENNINGLIGLDLLVNMNTIIDLKRMEIHFE